MKVVEDPQLVVKRKLPWFIDALFYPISVSGIIHIVIFLVVPFLISLISRFILSGIFLLGGIISLLLYLLFVGYVFFYLAYCIFDSSKGGRRAPDISTQHTPDKGDYISQIFLTLGCVAVCFWPVAVYYIFTRQADWIFWVLLVCGMFFFPMALLRGVMFDSFDALNPIVIIGSIFRTFLPYCGLVLFFCVPGRLVVIIISNLPKLKALHQIPFYILMVLNYLLGTNLIYQKIALIYLAVVAAHLLGRFYWWHKDKLDWGL